MSTSLPEMVEVLEKKSAPILVVDDDQKMRAALAQHLIKKGFSVIQASTPEEALNILRSHNVSVLVTYHKLTGTSGIDLLVKARELKPITQRVLLGSKALPDHIHQLIHPTELMIHPWGEQNLLQIINDGFERFRINFEHQSLRSILTRHHHALADVQSKLNFDLTLGGKIHQALLVDPPPDNLPGVSIFTESCISRDIDGDFISFFRHSDFLFDLTLGDVMGKGLPSALVGTAIRGEVAHFANPPPATSYTFDHDTFWHEDISSAKEIMQKVHSSVVDRLMALEFFVSLFYGRLDLRNRTFTFIDCGFTKPLYYRKASGKAALLSNSNFPLGTVRYHEYTPFEVHYDAGDFFLIYSDGITEAKSPQGELFGESRLKELVERHAHLLPNQLSTLIKEEVIQFTQEEKLEDDFTLIVIQIDSLTPLPSLKSSIAKFNSILSQLDAVRTLTREICSKSPGNTEKLSNEMQLAVDEVFTNIILHGYDKKAGYPIYIRAEYQEDQLLIEISDQGRPLNPLEIPEINLFGDRDHGYGWYLIRQIADHVSYVPKKSQNGWNHLRLYKHYSFRKGENMELTASEREGVLIIRLESENLDAKQVPEFKRQALELINDRNAEQVVFDLQKLQFIDSSGLGAFLSLLRQLHTREGHLCLAAMNKSVRTIFELVSMQKIFECYETVNQAIQAHVKR